MNDLGRLDSGSLKGLLEALLLVSDDSVAATDLARATGAAPGEVASALAELSAEYADANRGFQLREVAGGWRLFTHPAYHDQVADYVMSWDTRRLSQAALETLAVIAYHQPVTREASAPSAASTPTASSPLCARRASCVRWAAPPTAARHSSGARRACSSSTLA